MAKKRIQIETLRHTKAFEYYYALGAKRNVQKVCKRFGVSERSVYNWAMAFSWEKRIRERDSKISKELVKESEQSIEEIKKKHLKEIRNMMQVTRMAIDTTTKDMLKAYEGKKGGIKCDNISEFTKLIRTYNETVKLELNLLGESTEENPSNMTFAQISKNINIELNAIVGNGNGELQKILRNEIKKIEKGEE